MQTPAVHAVRSQSSGRRRFLLDARHDLRLSAPLSIQLFRAGLRAQRRRALLGGLWLFLPAAAGAGAASYVKSRGILAVAATDLPYPIFVFAGAVLWQLFVEALNAPLAQLSANRPLITKMQFPHEGLILAGVWSALLNVVIRFAAVLILCWLGRVPLGASAFLIPIGLAALALLGLAIGLLIAPFGLLYDDVGRGLQLLTGFLIFLMPVAYPIAREGLQRFNPVLPILDTTRHWLVGAGSGAGFVAAIAAAAVLLAVAWPLYRLARPHVLARLG